MTRRQFLEASSAAIAAPLGILYQPKPTLSLAIIADLHHGLAPDATERLRSFVEAANQRAGIDIVVQLGDFCYSQPESQEALSLWRRLEMPTIHVLGNHDMDKVDKDAAIRTLGIPSRYSSQVIGGYRLVVLDLNHFRKDGKLVPYAYGNYFTDNATHNWVDPEQLEWFERELHASKEPILVFSHQPIGFAPPGKPLPPEQAEILNVIVRARKANPNGGVVACICGHMHVDWLTIHDGIPCYCVNSASYFWYGGMQRYSSPLYAFVSLDAGGFMRISGVRGEFIARPPDASGDVPGRSASIQSRKVLLPLHRVRQRPRS